MHISSHVGAWMILGYATLWFILVLIWVYWTRD